MCKWHYSIGWNSVMLHKTYNHHLIVQFHTATDNLHLHTLNKIKQWNLTTVESPWRQGDWYHQNYFCLIETQIWLKRTKIQRTAINYFVSDEISPERNLSDSNYILSPSQNMHYQLSPKCKRNKNKHTHTHTHTHTCFYFEMLLSFYIKFKNWVVWVMASGTGSTKHHHASN